MAVLRRLKSVAKAAVWPVTVAVARARQVSPRPTRFAGAWPDREAALAALPRGQQAGYDDASIADVSFEAMARIVPADYPVMFWLSQCLEPGASVLDVGGHMAPKYIAFAPHLPVSGWVWTVQDLPGIVRAARAAQSAGRIPEAVAFTDMLDGQAPDLLLASGLLQYLDRPFASVLADLQAPPRCVLLNKVALRDGPEVVTLERIGTARVPYRIRSRAAFSAEIAALGYTIRDEWEVPGIAHVIPTHPWLGPSSSRGYLLERGD